MNWWGSGIIVMIYGGFSEAVEQQGTLLTENNFDILTENSKPLLVE